LQLSQRWFNIIALLILYHTNNLHLPMSSFNRRYFLKTSGLSLIPAALSGLPAAQLIANNQPTNGNDPAVKFFGDSDQIEPGAYLGLLQEAGKKTPIERDGYGQGGSVAALEKRFQLITGKEKAIFMPSGTMANQLAIAVLSGAKTKVFVQDTSHVYRDEADAAQAVFQKRLMPLANGASFFTALQLKEAIEALKEQEVFDSGIGVVSIENPVRRTLGRVVPLEEIKKINAYCRSSQLKTHLDGARLFLAAAWQGIPVKEYAAQFDTVYISLYKYLGANAGAILCGDKSVIDQMPHLMKIHGGTMYSNWSNAAMALLQLDQIDERLKQVKQSATELFASLNQLPGVQITTLPDGTNMYPLQLETSINGKLFHEVAGREFNIRFPRPNEKNETILTVNETLLRRDTTSLVSAFKNSILKSRT
jgi:threonine aldolase